MSYDPTERAPQPGGAYGQPSPSPSPSPAQPPAYGQGNPSPYEQGIPPTQAAPAYGQSNPPASPYGQDVPPTQAASYGQSSPQQPAYGQGSPQQPAYGQSSPQQPVYGQSSPQQPVYGQSSPQQPAYGQGSPQQPVYGQSSPQQPVYGQSNPSLPPYNQDGVMPTQAVSGYDQSYGQSSPSYPPYAAPQPGLDPYAQPGQPGQPWGQTLPPGYQAQVPPKKKSGLRIVLVSLVIVLVLAGSGIGYYILSRPKPVISGVTSSYKVGSVVAGASGTSFDLTGTDFTANSAITFLLDNVAAPGSQPVQSDSKGNVTATLAVTDGWTVGNHTITAKDAGGYLTKAGWPVTVVAAGQANTPGPHGAPTDSASGTLTVDVSAGDDSETLNLSVKGTPNGGTVCGTDDDGQAKDRSGTVDGEAYTETIAQTCSGTYKAGQLTYTETVTSDKIVFDDGSSCVASTPYVETHLTGSFTSATASNGAFSADEIAIVCTVDGTSQNTSSPAETGTWSGDASMQ